MLKSRAEKERLKLEKMRRVEQEMQTFANKLDEQLDQLCTLGREVRRLGDATQIKLLVAQYAVLEDYKRKIQKIMIDFKIAEKMRDIGAFTRDFFRNMSSMAREINKLSNDRALGGVVRDFAKNAENSELLMMDATDKMNETQKLFSNMLDMNGASGAPAPMSEDETRILGLFDRDEADAAIHDLPLPDKRLRL